FEVEVLTAADIVLLAPAALQILGPEVARRALEFIADGTICATPLDGESSSSAVDAIHHAVEEASRNTQPTAVVAVLPSMTTTGTQTLAAIAQQQPVADAKLPPTVANAFGDMLHALNHNVRVMEALPFRMATTPGSPKIGVLRQVHPCRGLVIDFPGQEPISSDDDGEE
uniref:Uncharacterized protein n=1 Tax=Romanomermis culicivorax TaxID=13658 RepID=A0A915HIM6_ROMCU